MNAIILSAIWGVVMMLGGVFIKNKLVPKYLAVIGLVVIFVAHLNELISKKSLFSINV